MKEGCKVTTGFLAQETEGVPVSLTKVGVEVVPEQGGGWYTNLRNRFGDF